MAEISLGEVRRTFQFGQLKQQIIGVASGVCEGCRSLSRRMPCPTGCFEGYYFYSEGNMLQVSDSPAEKGTKCGVQVVPSESENISVTQVYDALKGSESSEVGTVLSEDSFPV